MNTQAKQLTRIVSFLALGAAPAFGCASSQAPKELIDARAAYTRAESGYARELSPGALHEARVALDGAERNFADDGDSDMTRDNAYIATRKAELAEADGSTQHFQRELESAKERQGQAQAKNAVKTQEELVATREQLTQEKTARENAEKNAKQALDQLAAASAAAVKHEDRGTVITLSGGVLFASGKSELLPGAQTGLEQVATALKGQGSSKILIEGHTDSRGNAESNLSLSKARALSVQNFLATRGVPADQMSADGIGSGRPVADNATPEGRANNRRVEIIVQPGEPR
jgi:outer membrane protein OmpA-like peptidoglycan-associated protein